MSPATEPRPSPEEELALITSMLRIRRFEERCAQLYSAGKIRGFLHLSIGEEAIAAGVMPALTAEDAVVSTYREHGHALARGVPMGAVMAEMFGKQEGCSRGHGGSMHLFDLGRRFFGGNAIVAGGVPVAVGLALADVLARRPRVTACFLGDGAVAEGAFHESLNLAALWKLPVLFLCENNQYAMGTALSRYQAQRDLPAKAAADGVRASKADGMDVRAVAQASREAVARVRGGQGPEFIEFETYRFRAHSMFDPQHYRTQDEVKRWMARDPIPAFEQRLRAEDRLSGDRWSSVGASVDAEVEAAVRFAEAGTLEPVESLTRDVCAQEVER